MDVAIKMLESGCLMAVPLQTPPDVANEQALLSFFVKNILGRISTNILVRVVACSNDGGVSPVGTVDILPLVGQVTGDGQVIPHKTVYGVPYQRLQGGTNAVILDPTAGDLGVACVCSRDISAVKKSKAPGAPGSLRQYNIADAIYIGGMLNGTPEQYVRFSSGGVEVVSPTKITLRAPSVEIDASTQFTVASPASEFSGTIHTPETITGDTDVIADGISGATHTHGGVQSGGSNTAPPNP